MYIYNTIHEKILSSDWLRAVQFKTGNTSARRVTPLNTNAKFTQSS